MPANIAHMIIVHKAFELLRTKGFDDLAAFARTIDNPEDRKKYDYWKYMNLGSVGPDLYYYASMARSGREMLLEGFVQAAGATPWSYQLHSFRPNIFPLRLGEILFRDAIWEDGRVRFEADDMRKLAYIAGPVRGIRAAGGRPRLRRTGQAPVPRHRHWRGSVLSARTGHPRQGL